MADPKPRAKAQGAKKPAAKTRAAMKPAAKPRAAKKPTPKPRAAKKRSTAALAQGSGQRSAASSTQSGNQPRTSNQQLPAAGQQTGEPNGQGPVGTSNGKDGVVGQVIESNLNLKDPCDIVESFATSCGVVVVFPDGAQNYTVEPLAGRRDDWQITELRDHMIEVIAPEGVGDDEGCLVRAAYWCGGRQRYQVITTKFSGQTPVDEACETVEVRQTACGQLVIFPVAASEINVELGSDKAELEAAGLTITERNDYVIEVTPGSITQDQVDVTVSYRCGGRPYSAQTKLDFSTTTGRARRRINFKGSGAPSSAPPASGAAAAAQNQTFQQLFSRPISVAWSGSAGARAAGAGASPVPGLGAWTQQQTSALFPALPQNFSPAQFAQQLQQLGQQAAHPSPFGGGAFAVLGGPPVAAAPASAVGPMSSAVGGAMGTSSSGGAAMPGYAAGTWTRASAGGGGSGFGSPGSAPSSRQLAGPFAAAASIATALEETALPALRDVMPITPNADLDEVEAQRQIVNDALGTLIDEARRNSADGPDPIVVANADVRLQAALTSLQQALGLTTGTLVSTEDFANQSRFDILQQWVTIARNALAGTGVSATDPRPIIARVKELLRIVADSTRDLGAELDGIGVNANERARMLVPPTGPNRIRLGRLLEWIADEAGQQMPSLLDTAGRRAGASIGLTLAAQLGFINQLTTLTTDPWTHPIISQAVRELERQLTDAQAEASLL